VDDIYFDIFLTRLSLMLDILSNAFVMFFPSPHVTIHTLSKKTGSYSQIMFIAASSFSIFGSGVMPTVQSLALCILRSRSLANVSAGGTEVDVGIGRLFGALAVLQAVGQMIIGPMLFGLVYSTTVGTYPKAIFATAAGICVGSLVLVLMIRPEGSNKKRRGGVEIERGRSRISKDLRGYIPESSESASNRSGSDTTQAAFP